MATQTSTRRPFSWTGIGIGIVIAGILGVALPYGLSNFMPEKPAPGTTAAKAPAAAPPPPEIKFLGEGKVSGTLASLESDPGKTAELGVDDAMIVWLKVTSATPAAGGGAANAATAPKPGGPPAGASPVAASVGTGAGQQGGGGRRGGRLPLTVKDEAGRDYSYSAESKGDSVFALHLKKGYDKKPQVLTITQMAGDKALASWEVKDVPAPTIVLPDDSLKGAALGEIQLRPGRGGRLGASVHMTMPLPKNQGVILVPVAASYTQIAPSRGPAMLSKAGETPFDARLNLPNAQMARRVSFDMQTYQAAETTEIVTFHSARLDSRFGQPILIVDKEEIVTTPSGLKVKLPYQDQGPKRQPKRVRPEVLLQIGWDATGLTGESLAGIAPAVTAELVQPTAATLGLGQINLLCSASVVPEGQSVFAGVAPTPSKGTAGTAKLGPIVTLTLRITTTRAKVVSTKRIVLPVNPKVFPADPNAGGAGAPSAAQPRIS